MSLLRRLALKAWTRTESISTPNGPILGGGRSRSGVFVSPSRAMRHTAVWACVRLRAEAMGATPVGVVRHAGGRRHPQPDPTWLDTPNPEMTRFELFERTVSSIDVDGNSFWALVRDKLGRVREVWPLSPHDVTVFRDDRTARTPNPPKMFRHGHEEFTARHILHIPGFALAGRLRAPSPIELEMSAVGLAIAAEEFGESFFRNGAVMSGIITSPSDPGEPAVDRMRASFARDHQGLGVAHAPGFLFGGATWTQLTIPNNQSQFLETRKYQLTEIARIFRVPPHKIGDLEHAHFTNIEHQSIEWVTDGLVPYAARIEQAVRHAGLLAEDEQLRFNFAGQLRGDTASRYAAYAVARQWGWLSVDEIRALEDLNPLPDGIGETYLEPLNMIPSGTRDQVDADDPAVANLAVTRALVAAGVDPQLAGAATGSPLPEED